MKRIIILIVAIFLVIGLAQAQSAFIPETNLGIKLGGTISKVNFNPGVKQDLYPGFLGGLVFRHISQKSLGIQIEANYYQAGWSEKLDSPSSYSRRLNYIQLPLMTHVSLGKQKSRFFLNLGPYISVLLSDSEKIDLESESEYQDYYGIEIGGTGEFGLCFGLGFSKNTSIGIFQLEGRANYAMSNIFSNDQETSFTSSGNLSAEVALSYLLDLSKSRKPNKGK